MVWTSALSLSFSPLRAHSLGAGGRVRKEAQHLGRAPTVLGEAPTLQGGGGVPNIADVRPFRRQPRAGRPPRPEFRGHLDGGRFMTGASETGVFYAHRATAA